ncbi:thioredoxin family protein [Halobacillus rhizosphaerae]|uniref:thioredoxin family protein n=1 Tax=Halobacillus rhizosphaerae TaxID=3064889 RepID=UPI00398A942E
MKKNMLIFGGGLVLLLVILAVVVNYQGSKKSEGNPYGKNNLKQSTIDLLDDPLYQNIIQPDDLEKQIKSGESTTVYFFSPECSHCKRTTPIVVPLAKDMGVDLLKMNVLEFQSQWQKYKIEGTPTIIHFEDGEETARIVGENPESAYKDFFQKQAGKD